MQHAATAGLERREFMRQQVTREYEVRVGSYKQRLHTRDISDGGLFLETDGKPALPERTIVCLTEAGKEMRLGRVVRVTGDGMGVAFIRPADDETPHLAS